eukprot:31312-Pelagococcus_subviridis.AAC.13
MGASVVAMNRVPQFTPSAPSASAAASWLPVPTPPLATNGIHIVPDVVLAGVPRALEPVHAYAVRAEPLGGQRVFDRDALVYHEYSVFFEERDPLRRVPPRGLHDRHLLLHDHARVRAVVRRRERRQERQVHRERLRRERADASDLSAQILRRFLRERRDRA